MKQILLLLPGILTLTSVAMAQMDQGRIVGTVVDPTGRVIPRASIIVRNERTEEERRISTDEQGYFIVNPLRASTYSARAEAEGFSPSSIPSITLAVGQEVRRDFTLALAGITTEITVRDFANLDTSSARVGANVSEREVDQLPINGRQLSQLYLQAPGSQNSGSGTFNDIRFSGRSNNQNAIRYDGIEGSAILDASPGNFGGSLDGPFRLQSSLENVQEFRVESSNYPAEYGTGTGGQITVVTKSGSNGIHGSLFEYLRNDALDRPNYFDRPGDKSRLRMNQFGGSLGGPIVKNKVFFFGSYEGYRLRSGINFLEAVPSASACERAVASVAPLCMAAFRAPGAVVLPGESTSPDFDILQLRGTSVVNENAVGLRLDYQASEKWTIYGRFFRDQATNEQPEGVTGRRQIMRTLPQNGVFSVLGVLTPALVNEFKFGYNGALTRVNGIAPTIGGFDLSTISLSISGNPTLSGLSGQGASTGVAAPGGLLRQNSASNGRGAPYTPYTLSFIDSLNWTRGAHNFKLGGEVRMLRMHLDQLGGLTYTYQNLNAFLSNTLQQTAYLSDLSSPSPFHNGATGGRLGKMNFFIGYLQDEWRLRPGLTLSWGMRYEYYTALREDRNLAVSFDLDKGVIKPQGAQFYRPLKNMVQPRVGIAWSPGSSGNGYFGGGRTVVRAGFGIFNGPGQIEDLIQPMESDRVRSTINGGAFPVSTDLLVSNFTNNPLNRQYQPRAFSNEYSVPERIFQYTVGIQQELMAGTVLTASYVGSQGRNLFLRSVANQITSVRTVANAAVIVRELDIDCGAAVGSGSPLPAGCPANSSLSTVLRPYAEIDFKTSGGYDNYNSLQLSLVRRAERGLTLGAQYTLGRSFGNTAGANEALTAGNNARTAQAFDYDLGYNNFDVRHTYNISAVYALPIGRGYRMLGTASGLAQAVLGNWELGTILNGRSGLPMEMKVVRPDIVWVDGSGGVFNSFETGRTAVVNTPGGGASRNVRRPDLVPGVDPYLKSGLNYLNPAAFAVPKPGTFGNLQRGVLRGPLFSQVDLTVGKRFPMGEAKSLEFRTEFFNLFNRTNFTSPSAVLQNPLGTGANQIQPGQPYTAAAAGSAFGLLTSTVSRTVGLGTNRQIQFALRFNF